MKLILAIFFLLVLLFGVMLFFVDDSPNNEEKQESEPKQGQGNNIPLFLKRGFENTDFTNANTKIEKALSGGPGKDGIPSLSYPKFDPIQDSKIREDVLTIVLHNDNETRVYPYNILTWHEIVNDEIDGKPVAVTFCPLCGSAIVFDRRIGGEVLEFAVSGALIESNMVMYDKDTESLWQQSTGEGLAGAYVGRRLTIVPMQLLTIAEVKEKFPDAQIVSEDTGHRRNYDRNPYSGYEDTNNQFFFPVGDYGDSYPSKEIMVVFKVDKTPVAIPMKKLEETPHVAKVGETTISLSNNDGEIEIFNQNNLSIPFYFEMWFSFSVQHGANAIVL